MVELAAILLLAAALRAYGLDFGLPAVYNMDEVAITSRALGFAKGDLNPHNFLYPTFFFYVLFGWLGASFARGARHGGRVVPRRVPAGVLRGPDAGSTSRAAGWAWHAASRRWRPRGGSRDGCSAGRRR